MGARLPKRGKWYVWSAIGPAKDRFEALIVPNIDEIFQSIEPPQDVGFMVRLYMIGRGNQGLSANPIITVCCWSKKTCKEAMEAMQGVLEHPGLSGFGRGYAPTPLEMGEWTNPRAHLRLLCDEPGSTSLAAISTSEIAVYAAPGHWIGRKLRFVVSAGTDTTPTARDATGGPVIRLGNDLYQITVAHAAQPEAFPKERADAGSYWFQDRYGNDSEDDEDDSAGDEIALTLASVSTPRSAIPEDADHNSVDAVNEPFSASNASSSNALSGASSPPSPIPRNMEQEPSQQPRTPAEDGYSFLGSISNPCNREIMLDYMILKLSPDEVAARSSTHDRTLDLSSSDCKIADINNDIDVNVSVVTSHGFIPGKITPGSCLVKFPKSSKFQRVFTVNLSEEIKAGDSGSAVIDARNRDFYGHIALGILPGSVAYIVPAVDVFADLQSRFGQAPSLYQFSIYMESPGNEQQQNPLSTKQLSITQNAEQQLPPRGKSKEARSVVIAASSCFTRLTMGLQWKDDLQYCGSPHEAVSSRSHHSSTPEIANTAKVHP